MDQLQWPQWLQDLWGLANSIWTAVVEQFQAEVAFRILVLLIILAVVAFLVTWFFELSSKTGKSRGGSLAHVSMQPNKTNGMVTPEVDYPVVVKLLELDAEQKPTAKVLGFSIRPAPGPKEPIFLLLEGEWTRLEPIQSLNHLHIEKIQDELRDGIREDIPPADGDIGAKKQFRQVTPPGHFSLNGEIWKLDQTISLAGELVRGQLFSFKGGRGVFELMLASVAGAPDEGSVLVLEKTVDEFRRAINETWMSYNVFPSSLEEASGRVEADVLSPLKLAAVPA